MMVFIKKFPLTLLCVLTIWYLCLFRPPHVSLFDGITFFDKWVHMSMYLGTCSIFWLEYLRSSWHWSLKLQALVAVVAPIVMSGLIELAQNYLTTYRSGEWADFIANSTGVLLALVVRQVLQHVLTRNK